MSSGFCVPQLLEHLKGGRTTVFHGTSTLHKPVLGLTAAAAREGEGAPLVSV